MSENSSSGNNFPGKALNDSGDIHLNNSASSPINLPPTGKSPAFANAVERARQIASKIKPDGVPVTGGIKRPNEDNFGGPESKKLISGPPPILDPFFANKKSAMDNGGDAGGSLTETIMVPDKMVGLIIGRGGEQITRLQAESGCKIQMAQDSAGMSERSCTLTGNPQAIGQAKSMISRIIDNEGNNGGPGPAMVNNSRPPNGPPGGHGSGFYEMNVPGQKVGLIIGKGGETIKQLQENSGAKIVIIQDGPEAALEKPLRITGTPENVERAKVLVSEILNQDHGSSHDMNNGGHPGGGGGYRGRGRGRGGAGIPRGGYMGRGGRGGGRGGYTPGGGQWGSNGASGGGAGGSEYGGTHTDYIMIPANKCGLVIGKGGETIKNINSTSGAHCEVDKSAPPDAREKNFVIRGPPDAVERAKQMIMEKIGLSAPNGAGYDNGSSYGGAAAGGWPGASSAPGGQYQQSGYQDPNMGAQQGGGAPDYSAQWAEYYRSMGMIREAEAIEKHMNGNRGAPGGMPNGVNPAVPQSIQPAAAAPAVPGNGAAPGGGGPDYSAQWAEYYRSVGKHKEAEAIENQMKAKGNPAAAAAPAGGQGYPGAAQYAAGYYGGSQAAAAPQPAGYPGAPAATGYPGYPGYQPGQES